MRINLDNDGTTPRNERGYWLPGHSGNPSGRTAGLKNVVRLAREYTQDAIRTLAEIMNDPEQPSACRIVASNSLLDRAWGKPIPADEVPDDADRAELVHAMLAVFRSGQVRLTRPGYDDER
jgi:hypothetical protein